MFDLIDLLEDLGFEKSKKKGDEYSFYIFNYPTDYLPTYISIFLKDSFIKVRKPKTKFHVNLFAFKKNEYDLGLSIRLIKSEIIFRDFKELEDYITFSIVNYSSFIHKEICPNFDGNITYSDFIKTKLTTYEDFIINR